MSTRGSFRVLIAGGGIAGLALANSLQKANIEYLVLESRNEIAPQVGASIALNANGARILDQLGVYDTLEDDIMPATFAQGWKDGKLYENDDAAQLGHVR